MSKAISRREAVWELAPPPTRLRLGSDLRKLRIEHARLPEIAARIRALEHELQVCRDNGVLQKLDMHRRLDQVDQQLADNVEAIESEERWGSSLTDVKDQFADLQASLTAIEDDLTRQATNVLAETSVAIDRAYADAVAAMRSAHHRLTGLRGAHTSRVRALTDELNAVKQELHADKIDADAVLRCTRELDALRIEHETLVGKQADIARLGHERRGILDELNKARENQSRVRQDAAEVINNRLSQRLQVVVTPDGDNEQFATALKNLLARSSTQATAVAAITAQEGIDGAQIAAIVEAGADEIARRFSISRTQADKIYAWLTDPEADRLAELEGLAPRDGVNVLLNTGQGSSDLDHLSTGQRATAILLLIFTVDGRAMLLDQPEDDLDNQFIFDDIVTMIRQQKALTAQEHDRQIIAATHNPNIPMLGDAELVAVLDATNAGMVVGSQGSIDNLQIRTHIRQVLEGGEEAFMRRYQKYGGMRLALPTGPARYGSGAP
ncbi:AAA family ATPase [Actinoplanes sp. TBRC 11911]|uniref:AAA family ATPase n=1 Tax=Actinoplanes sp. TBRC 11911 TaxID=2729386 RepID=UPI00145DA0C1|nr:AAA family ATPase [Actinoplanes sp. TBRC 11911]NMO53438.1 AAA family ATPase [Actinoplanes sp. TBRC 11911]